MPYQHSTVTMDGYVMTVTINRPEVRNALHADAHHELAAIFDDFERNSAARIAILTGAGDVAFCAGADVRTVPTRQGPTVPETGFAGLTARFNRRKPIIAAVNGFAIGGGFEVALACDIIIAARHATFGLTEPRIGLAALGGGIQRIIAEIGTKRAHVMLLTARAITAPKACAMGFVADVASPAALLPTARHLAEEILECSPASIAATKAIVQSMDGNSLEISMQCMFALPEVRALLAGTDAHEGITAFTERRKPVWTDPA